MDAGIVEQPLDMQPGPHVLVPGGASMTTSVAPSAKLARR